MTNLWASVAEVVALHHQVEFLVDFLVFLFGPGGQYELLLLVGVGTVRPFMFLLV